MSSRCTLRPDSLPPVPTPSSVSITCSWKLSLLGLEVKSSDLMSTELETGGGAFGGVGGQRQPSR